MKQYTSNEIQDISARFRSVARRLSTTDYSQCASNLKRFMLLLENEPIISEFVKIYNIIEYDISKEIKERNWVDPFQVSPIMENEISFSIQILRYSVDNFDGDFTRLYGTYIYTSTNSNTNDEMRKFIAHIIDPLIDYISDFLKQRYNEILESEGKNNVMQTPTINSTNSIINIANQVGGNINNQSTVNTETYSDALEIIKNLDNEIDNSDIDSKDEIKEILEQIKTEIENGNTPTKGLLTALKTLCSGIPKIISYIKTLITLFSHK